MTIKKTDSVIMEVPFFQVPNWIYDQVNNLSIYEKAVYFYLCRCSNQGKAAFPSYSTIATKTGMSRRKAIEAVNNLIALQYLVKTRQGSGKNHKSNLYQVVHDLHQVVHDVHYPSAPGALDLVHDLHPKKNYIKRNIEEEEKALPLQEGLKNLKALKEQLK